tara:strand:+ start:31 stop:846 length:816 start_codon:yes stop_codon:yes gene_type:complete
MTSWDIATPTSLGTGVAKTEINGAQPLTKPTQAQTLIEVVPYMASIAALTPAQTMMTKCIIESNSINLLPKNFLVPPTAGGLGTFTSALTPMLDTVETMTPLQLGATQQFRIYGQNFIANTVANKLGLALHYSEAQTNAKEMFYDLPTNESNTGVAATSVAGENFTINDGKWLETITPLVTAGVVTASESYLASIEISSNDFDNSMPLKVPCQPIATALGSHVSVGIPKLPSYHNIHMGMKSSCLISQTLTLDEALTATGNFIAGIGYTKS